MNPTIQYPINDCYTCIQGEGVQTGVAMVLLRLQGCAVGCPWCDTKETWAMGQQYEREALETVLGNSNTYTYLSPTTIANYIKANHPGPHWVLVTGGEPAQYNLRPLVDALHTQAYHVAIETSGTEAGHIDADFDWVCVSPKLNMPGGKSVLPPALAVADEIKHVVGRQRDIEELDELLATITLKPNVQITLQPVSQNKKATQLCIDVVQKRGWRLSVQLHKYINAR